MSRQSDQSDPLDYESPSSPTMGERGNRLHKFASRAAGCRRIARIIYLVVCAIGLFFAIRYLIHYTQLIDQAINFNKK